MDMLSVFMTPCTKPTRIQCATMCAVRSQTVANQRARLASVLPSIPGKSRAMVKSASRASSAWSRRAARISKLLKRMKLGAILSINEWNMRYMTSTWNAYWTTPASGLRYALFFDDRSLDGDVRGEVNGVAVVTDKMSAPYLSGASIDYLDTLEKSGFTIDNPNAAGSCACGESFH